jgi:hypothetical protein
LAKNRQGQNLPAGIAGMSTSTQPTGSMQPAAPLPPNFNNHHPLYQMPAAGLLNNNQMGHPQSANNSGGHLSHHPSGLVPHHNHNSHHGTHQPAMAPQQGGRGPGLVGGLDRARLMID